MATQNEHDWVQEAAAVELPMRRLVDGRGTGARRSRRTGDGFDISGVRPFRDGDEVRRIDWSATARTGEIHVRTTHAESGMRTLVALDMNPSMAFGTTGWKADAALDIMMLLGHAAARRGDQVAVATGAGTSRAASGIRAQRLLAATRTTTDNSPTAKLAELLVADTRPAVPSGLVVVVTEIFSELFTTYADVLRMVGTRHELFVVAVHDPVEVMLPPSDAIYVFRAPGSDADVVVDLSDLSLRQTYADAVHSMRVTARDTVSESGGFFVEISTAGDVIESLIDACNTISSGAGMYR